MHQVAALQGTTGVGDWTIFHSYTLGSSTIFLQLYCKNLMQKWQCFIYRKITVELCIIRLSTFRRLYFDFFVFLTEFYVISG